MIEEGETMFAAVNLQASKLASSLKFSKNYSFVSDDRSLRRRYCLRPPDRRLSPPAVRSEHDSSATFSLCSEAYEPSLSSRLTATVGSPPIQASRWSFTQRHVLALNIVACAVAVSTTWLFYSAIPALLAFKRAAESLEKLMDAAREELPDTMAAIRLSGMEISDLTMELSDLGQEITHGVRSSTRAVRLAEERLRRLTSMVPGADTELKQQKQTERIRPVLATNAKSLREGIVKGRAVWQTFFRLARFSRIAFNYLGRRAKG